MKFITFTTHPISCTPSPLLDLFYTVNCLMTFISSFCILTIEFNEGTSMGSTHFTRTRSIISGYTSEEMTFMHLALEQFSLGPLTMFWLDYGKREILFIIQNEWEQANISLSVEWPKNMGKYCSVFFMSFTLKCYNCLFGKTWNLGS